MAGGDDLPVAGGVFDHDGAAVVDDAAGKIDAFREGAAFMEVLVNGVASGADDAGDEDFITDFQGADGVFGERRGEQFLGLSCR